MNFYSYWGKAQPIEKYPLTAGTAFHLLAYHCLDVAAVGQVLLTQKLSFSHSLSKLIGINNKVFMQWFTFLLALHDLGKFTESFQNLKPDLLQTLQQRTSSQAYLERHDTLGWVCWEQCGKALLQAKGLVSKPNPKFRRSSAELTMEDIWMAAMVGHHGQPPKPRLTHAYHYYLNEAHDFPAITEFVEALIPVLLPDQTVFPTCDKSRLKQASWWLSGLAVLSDWLGSNTTFFPYQSQPMPLADYWQQALKQAEKAIQATELFSGQAQPHLMLSDLLGKTHASTTQTVTQATPLQALTQDWPMEQSPHLFILEDVTGAGKTEAALLLAHRLMQVEQANSLYFALPTMATANSMYRRMKDIYRRLFSTESNPSLVLAHGASDMVKDFRESVLPKTPTTETAYGDDTAPAGAHCNAWVADNRKKALLADVGIGTIDQALLAILPSRHQALRLLGLLNKVLIVDEIHAADAYQHELLQALLKAHACAGGSAILLSATLPEGQRQALVNAFAEGCQWSEPNLQKTDATSYPLLTCLNQSGLQEIVVGTRESVKREVAVTFIHEFSAVEQVLAHSVEQSQCVCWIRNTVKDAVEAFQQLQALHPDWQIDLFHARFALGDRLDIEKRVVGNFDKASSILTRKGQILIATQVVEQSLDLDFDFLVTDLAPIDLLIQRAGRLRRHQRDSQGNRIQGKDERGQAVLHIYSPSILDQPAQHWYASFFPNAQKVYDHHGQLWLTAQLLAQQGKFTMPEDARTLIEDVYGIEAQEQIPETLLHCSSEAEGSDRADASLARLNQLSLAAGYHDGVANRWWDESKTPTRIGDPSTQVYLAKWQDGVLQAWYADQEHAWALSTVSMRSFWVSAEYLPSDMPAQVVEQCKESLPAKGQWGVLLVLQAVSEHEWQGQALRKVKEQDQIVTFSYDTSFGLRIKD
jgi:CRISPR-associated endonuclease/helicase Cas3